MVKNLPTNAGDTRDTGSIPGLGRFPGGKHDNPIQYSCLENPMDRRAWWATVHNAAKSRTGLKQSKHKGVDKVSILINSKFLHTFALNTNYLKIFIKTSIKNSAHIS